MPRIGSRARAELGRRGRGPAGSRRVSRRLAPLVTVALGYLGLSMGGLLGTALAEAGWAQDSTSGSKTSSQETSRVWVFRAGGEDHESVVKTLERVKSGQIVFESASGREMTLPAGERGYLGVHVLEISNELRSHWGLPEDHGVLVSRVVVESPASRAGVEVGDVLLAVDGSPVVSSWDLKRLIAPRRAEEPVRLKVARMGMVWTLEAVLEGRQSRTLDLAPLIHTDQDGRVVLVAPHPRAGDASSQFRWSFRRGDDTSDHLELAYEEAIEALGDVRLQEVVGEEAETRKELEERIEFLERRLREVELQLEATPKPKGRRN